MSSLSPSFGKKLPLQEKRYLFFSLLLNYLLVVFQFQLFSSWGDPYYIGLNGLEFYDENGYQIQLTENNITAFPHSVNVLEGVKDDARTPDKLIDGINDTKDGRHMWLAPILPGIVRALSSSSFFVIVIFSTLTVLPARRAFGGSKFIRVIVTFQALALGQSEPPKR